MVGHQLVISLAYYNNLALQLYFNGSTTCYLEVVMVCQQFAIQNPGGARVPPCTCPRAPMRAACNTDAV